VFITLYREFDPRAVEVDEKAVKKSFTGKIDPPLLSKIAYNLPLSWYNTSFGIHPIVVYMHIYPAEIMMPYLF